MLRAARERVPSWSVLTFYTYAVTGRAAFSYPIFVLFFRSRGLSFAEIGAIEATYTVVVLLAETPTGYLGDRLGRRGSMIAGTVLSAAGAVGYALAHAFPAFLAVSALRAVAGAFKSGASDAWLYETLADEQDADEFAHVRGRASSLGIVSHGAAAVAGGALYAVHPLLPWAGDAVTSLVGTAVLLTADDPGDAESEESPGVRHLAGVARRTLAKRSLGAFVLYTGLLFGLLNTVEMFVQPTSVEVLDIPAANLGFLYAGFTVLSAALASQTERIRERVGTRAWFALAPPLLGLLFFAVLVEPWLALAAFFAMRGVAAVSRPLASQYLNDRTASEGRATVLSAASMVRSTFTAPLNVAGGALAGALLLPETLGVLGATLLVGAGAIMLWRFPVVDDGEVEVGDVAG
jgi:MFS family permease